MTKHKLLKGYRPFNNVDYIGEPEDMLNLDSKTKEQTDYLFNQIEPFLDRESSLNDFEDVKKIIYKTLKVFNQGR
jgi:hypothetical protein